MGILKVVNSKTPSSSINRLPRSRIQSITVTKKRLESLTSQPVNFVQILFGPAKSNHQDFVAKPFSKNYSRQLALAEKP